MPKYENTKKKLRPWPKNLSVRFNLPPPFTASLCLCSCFALCFHANVVDDVVKLTMFSLSVAANIRQTLTPSKPSLFFSPVYSLI